MYTRQRIGEAVSSGLTDIVFVRDMDAFDLCVGETGDGSGTGAESPCEEGGGEEMDVVKGAGWKGVNWML